MKKPETKKYSVCIVWKNGGFGGTYWDNRYVTDIEVIPHIGEHITIKPKGYVYSFTLRVKEVYHPGDTDVITTIYAKRT